MSVATVNPCGRQLNMTNANTTADDDADTDSRTTLLTYTKVEADDGTEQVAVSVDRDGEDRHRREVAQYESLAGTPPLHEELLAMAESLGVDTRVIEFPKMLSLHTDETGRYYITDLNEVIRYYPDEGVLCTTDDYEDKELVADGTQRKNDLREMYRSA